MDDRDRLKPRNTVDILLDHQTQRLEDIANNAVDFIRINLIVLGAFMPFLATVLTDIVSPEAFIGSRFSEYTVYSWLVSTVVATFVYKISRSRSMSHFDTLQQAIINDWREEDLRAEIIDQKEDYDRLTTILMLGMTVSIGTSLMTILLLGLGLSDQIFGFSTGTENIYFAGIIIVSTIAAIGVESLNLSSGVVTWVRNTLRRLSSKVESWLQDITRIELKLPIFTITAKRDRSDSRNPEEHLIDLFEEEGLSPIRAQLLKAIHETKGLDNWTYGDLVSDIEEEFPDIGVTKQLVSRLVDEGYIKEISQEGDSTLIIHERENEIISGDDLDDRVGEELGRLIGHIREDEYVKETVAEDVGVRSSGVEQALVEGSTSDRIDKLNSAVERLKDDPNVGNLNFGKIEFRRRANRYRLTPKAIKPFALIHLENGKQAFVEENLVQASVLASQGLELYLRSVYLQDNPQSREDVLKKGIGQLLSLLQDEDMKSHREREMFDRIRDIRNRAVHSQGAQLRGEEVKELLSIAEDIIRDGL